MAGKKRAKDGREHPRKLRGYFVSRGIPSAKLRGTEKGANLCRWSRFQELTIGVHVF